MKTMMIMRCNTGIDREKTGNTLTREVPAIA